MNVDGEDEVFFVMMIMLEFDGDAEILVERNIFCIFFYEYLSLLRKFGGVFKCCHVMQK